MKKFDMLTEIASMMFTVHTLLVCMFGAMTFKENWTKDYIRNLIYINIFMVLVWYLVWAFYGKAM